LNPSGFADTPYIRVSQMTIEQANQVYRLACLEVRGGNDLAAYAAELPGLAGWVSCRPLRPSHRGGDLYYMSACGHGVVARVVLADVSGHGDAVGDAAVRLRDALRKHVELWDQSMLIRQLSDDFLAGARQTQFATAFLASYYSETGELLFTNAGHMPPLWYRTATRKWNFLDDSTPLSKEIVDLPLGLIAGTSYSQTAVQLEAGDLLLLYTDGISEATNESGAQLGLERLLSIAGNLPVDSAIAAGKAIVAAVGRFSGGAPPADDQTVVVLQRRKGA
jgi:sigma-B regulation protein RsbU (phosphoserine phosphatase)